MADERDSPLRCAALVPVWNPEPHLPDLVRGLLASGFGSVVLVDDGSDASYADDFAALAAMPRVSVLRHPRNRGKGRALKTGFEYMLNASPVAEVVVTADGDGQHLVCDIVRVALHALAQGDIVLGARRFEADVPWRSRFGNAMTRQVFRWIAGQRLADTQTGLRAFPRSLLPALLQMDGERYEYEMTVLTQLGCTRQWTEVPIQTVYLDGNRSSRFKPVRDSLRIYGALLRFLFWQRLFRKRA